MSRAVVDIVLRVLSLVMVLLLPMRLRLLTIRCVALVTSRMLGIIVRSDVMMTFRLGLLSLRSWLSWRLLLWMNPRGMDAGMSMKDLLPRLCLLCSCWLSRRARAFVIPLLLVLMMRRLFYACRLIFGTCFVVRGFLRRLLYALISLEFALVC